MNHRRDTRRFKLARPVSRTEKQVRGPPRPPSKLKRRPDAFGEGALFAELLASTHMLETIVEIRVCALGAQPNLMPPL